MEDSVQALVCSRLHGPYDVQTLILGRPRDDEVVVRMVATGICHTDYACTNGSIPVSFPFVGGHEGAGIVEFVGSKVRKVEAGDHVLLTFSTCGECEYCRKDSPAYCKHMREYNFRGSRMDGSTAFSLPGGQAAASHFFGQSSFAAKAVVRERCLVKVDKNLPLETLCSFGCGMQTGAGTVLNVLRPELGSTVAIFGAGAVGMAALMAAKLTPASKIIAIDVVESKLEIARELGATDTINPVTVNVVDEVRRLTYGLGVDRALDATGKISCIQDMLDCAGPGAVVVTVGAPPMEQILEIKPAIWLEKGVKYMGAHQGSSVPQEFIPLLIQFWKTARFPVERLISTYDFKDIQAAHRDLVDGKCIKAVLLWK